MLMGSERSVKYLLDLLSSGSGFLFDEDDTDLGRALKRAGDELGRHGSERLWGTDDPWVRVCRNRGGGYCDVQRWRVRDS